VREHLEKSWLKWSIWGLRPKLRLRYLDGCGISEGRALRGTWSVPLVEPDWDEPLALGGEFSEGKQRARFGGLLFLGLAPCRDSLAF
jgi:hypothetical protein